MRYSARSLAAEARLVPVKGSCTLARLGVLGCLALAVLSVQSSALADLVLYRIPNTRLIVSLQGDTTVHPGRTVSFRHPRFGRLIFGLQNARIHETPTIEARFERQLRDAKRKNEADAVIEAARFALMHGLLPEFYSAIDVALEIDPKNRPGRRVRYLQYEMARPIPESEEAEKKLFDLVGRSEMRISKSPHFMLLHDTPEKPPENRDLPQAEERLALLEKVYESFLLRFFLDNVKLDIPRERLQVVLFAHKDDYLRFATQLDPALQSASGFWSTKLNVSFFYAQATGASLQALSKLSDELQQLKQKALRMKAANTREIVRMANTITLLVEITKENEDIEVVSHEATHQLAGNTGLFPRNVAIPFWVHEGLATYFEAPNDAAWRGMGAVNHRRLSRFRGIQAGGKQALVDAVIRDRVFSQAKTIEAKLHGYAQAWALTHFLMDRHFTKLVRYYRLLGELPKERVLTEDQLAGAFAEAFGQELSTLDTEWQEYMGGLRTDVQKILEEAADDR